MKWWDQRHYFANKSPSSQNCGVGEASSESLGLQGDQAVNPKENQPWIFIGRTDADSETPVLWPPDLKNWLTWKHPDAGKDWRQEEKGMTEGEMVWWHHWLNGSEFEQALGVGAGQGSLACCSPWGHKESDMTERLNNWARDSKRRSPPFFCGGRQHICFRICWIWGSFAFKGPLGQLSTQVSCAWEKKLNFRYKFTVKKHVGCK